MPKQDTEVTQLVINIGTTEKLTEEMNNGNITENMLSISTNGPDYLQYALVITDYTGD